MFVKSERIGAGVCDRNVINFSAIKQIEHPGNRDSGISGIVNSIKPSIFKGVFTAEESSFKAGSRATNRVQRVTGEIEVIVNKEENRGGVKRGIISVNKVREKDPLVGGMNNVRVRLGAFSG